MGGIIRYNPLASEEAATKLLSILDILSSVAGATIAQRLKRSAQVGHEKLRLFPRGEVGAFVVRTIIDEFGICLLRPTLRRLIDLFGKIAHGDRDRDAPHIEETTARRKSMPSVPVELC